ncbi:MAG: hypothetical protein EOO24_51420 [Comamonadaceae bacterium]|nr:MAG: hypothetical protein EOO24_51420 [Comamonadaceae bacterium]
MRATDVVGAGGPHLGTVRTYAAPEDIASLKRGRYIGSSPLSANPLLAADISAHTIKNFLPDNDVIRHSALSPVNEANGRAHAAAIAHYRDDVMRGRLDLNKVANKDISFGVAVNGVRMATQAAEAAAIAAPRIPGKAASAAGGAMISGARRVGQALDEATQTMRDGASRVGDKLSRPSAWLSSQADPEAPSLITDPGHPGRPMFAQAQGLLQTINRDRGIPCDQRTDNAAACVAVVAREAGLTRIDHVEFNTRAEQMFAVQGKPGTEGMKLAGVDTVKALDTPIAQSSQAFVVADLQVRQQESLQQQQQQEQQRSEQLAQPVRMRM